jgi:signal transduction histidine kinase
MTYERRPGGRASGGYEVDTVMPLVQGRRGGTTDRMGGTRGRQGGRGAEAARERRRLRRELDQHLVPVFEALHLRARNGEEDEASVQADLALHAHGLRRWVERLARASADGGTVSAVAAQERVRLARRLHDTALQLVEYVVTDAYGTGLTREDVARHLGDAVVELRGAAAAGEPAGDVRHGVESAIGDARRLGLGSVALEGDALDAQLAGADLDLVVGTVREALTNVRKHARARQAVVRVERVARDLRVSVEDDGVGLDRRALSRSQGLGMRVSILGRAGARAASVRVDGKPGAGTRVVLTMPNQEQQS